MQSVEVFLGKWNIKDLLKADKIRVALENCLSKNKQEILSLISSWLEKISAACIFAGIFNPIDVKLAFLVGFLLIFLSIILKIKSGGNLK